MVEENRCQSRSGLLDDIKRGSRLLEQQLLQFTDWIGDRKIVSFLEMQQTKKLQKVCEIKYIYPAAGFPAFVAPSNLVPKNPPANTCSTPPQSSLTKKKR